MSDNRQKPYENDTILPGGKTPFTKTSSDIPITGREENSADDPFVSDAGSMSGGTQLEAAKEPQEELVRQVQMIRKPHLAT